MKESNPLKRRLLIIAGCLSAASAAGMAGCTGESRQSAGDRALADPWNYGPKPGKPDSRPQRDGSSFDRDGFKRDLNNVFNP